MSHNRHRGPRERTLEEVAEAEDLFAVIATALQATPVDEQSLRRAVLTYANSELRIGALASTVMERLTTIVDASSLPYPARETVRHRVLLWCFEAYFDHIGGEPHTRSKATTDSSASLVAW